MFIEAEGVLVVSPRWRVLWNLTTQLGRDSGALLLLESGLLLGVLSPPSLGPPAVLLRGQSLLLLLQLLLLLLIMLLLLLVVLLLVLGLRL